MQKKIFFLFTITALMVNTLYAQDKSFVLNGLIDASAGDLSGTTVYLKKNISGQPDIVQLDSTIVENNRFTFKGEVPGTPTIYYVSAGSKAALFSPEAGQISMQIGQKNRISGTAKNNQMQAFLDLQESISTDLKEINSRYSVMENTEESRQSWLAEVQPLRDKLEKGSYSITKDNIKNEIGEYLLTMLYQVLPDEQLAELMEEARPAFLQSESGQRLSKYTVYRDIQQGKGRYLDMTLQTPDGKEVSLSDYVGKGKYVLIDFWASWCGPCVRELPKLAETYSKYKDKGFEIIGISLDERKQDWLSAIDRFNMTWVNMSDLKGWKSLAGTTYGITSIPFTLLVDKEGNIMESYLYGEELNYRLQEILD